LQQELCLSVLVCGPLRMGAERAGISGRRAPTPNLYSVLFATKNWSRSLELFKHDNNS
jgi:hypothetical protein